MTRLGMMAFVCLLGSYMFTLSAFANISHIKVIYGEDSRVDLGEVQDGLFYDLAKSTAAMVPRQSIQERGSFATITGSLLADRGVCRDERFADQVTAAQCSGFLVAPDLLVTAGHCITGQRACDSHQWVFDFSIDVGSHYQLGSTEFEVDTRNVYACTEIIEQLVDRSTGDDYALIRLDREVEDRLPLEFRRSGEIVDRTSLVVIGHPTGLPTKVASDSWVRDNRDQAFFVANLDTFGGNSGSAVFDAYNGVVEGILVRGEQDYVFDHEQNCRRPKRCELNGCRGEDVARITRIPNLLEYTDLPDDDDIIDEDDDDVDDVDDVDPGEDDPAPEPRCFVFFGLRFCF